MFKLLPLAFRSLLRNRRRSGITLTAIAVGVAVVVFANAFGAGFINMMVEQAVNGKAGAVQVHRKGYMEANEAAPLKLDMPDGGELLDKIKSTPGITAVTRRIRFGGMINDGTRSSMIIGQALDPVHEYEVCPERGAEVDEKTGTHISPKEPRGAVLGREIAVNYQNANAGASMTITAAGREGGINALDLKVLGLTRGALPIESKRMVSVPLAYGQELLQMEGRATEYAMAVDDLKNLDRITTDLRARLGDDYEVSQWSEVVPFLRDLVDRLRIILGGVSVVLFVIVIFGVVNTMLMSVYERVREIGTMLAVGLRRRQVLALFLLEAAALGLLGGAVGALSGFAVSSYFAVKGIVFSAPGSSFTQLVRPDVEFPMVVVAVVVAMIGALLAAAYPAWRASKMNPVEALRTL